VRVKTIIFNVLISILVSAGMLYAYHVKFSQRVVVFDLERFIREQVQIKLQGGNVDDTMMAVKRYIDSLPENVIVLPNTAVLHGGKPLVLPEKVNNQKPLSKQTR
jgi:hypothetical protein